jgi:hypothetical protein
MPPKGDIERALDSVRRAPPHVATEAILIPLLFVFGTLLDPKTRARVLGRPERPRETVPALLHGCERVWARGRRYPVLIRDPAGAVDGLLLTQLSARDRARLRVYEGREYRLARVRVRVLGNDARAVWARAFMAQTLGATQRPWLPFAR